MKRFLTILLLLSCFFPAFAQADSVATPTESGFMRFFRRLYIPCEVGVSYYSAGTLKAGYTLKAAIEWRHHQDKGVYYCLLYNDRTMSYADQLLDGTNLSKGKAHFSDIIIGPGYRFGICEKFRIATMAQVGVSFCDYNDVVPDLEASSAAKRAIYSLEDRQKILPVLKLSAYFEYYLFKTFALYISAGYVQHLQSTPFSTALRTDGSLDVNIGFTTTLY